MDRLTDRMMYRIMAMSELELADSDHEVRDGKL